MKINKLGIILVIFIFTFGYEMKGYPNQEIITGRSISLISKKDKKNLQRNDSKNHKKNFTKNDERKIDPKEQCARFKGKKSTLPFWGPGYLTCYTLSYGSDLYSRMLKNFPKIVGGKIDGLINLMRKKGLSSLWSELIPLFIGAIVVMIGEIIMYILWILFIPPFGIALFFIFYSPYLLLLRFILILLFGKEPRPSGRTFDQTQRQIDPGLSYGDENRGLRPSSQPPPITTIIDRNPGSFGQGG